MKYIGNSWDEILEEEYKKEYFTNLIKFVEEEYKNKTVYPEEKNIFRALKTTDYENLKVVILGQDPYHGEKEANGLAFSVNRDVKIPPSLRNIFKELENDISVKREDTDLIDWAEDGVLLLNTILTVEKDKAFSHQKYGWETFTDAIIKKINEIDRPIVYILWGNAARSKKEYINNPKHFIIESAHPSPLSANRGFFGTKPFSKANKFLKDNGIKEVEW